MFRVIIPRLWLGDDPIDVYANSLIFPQDNDVLTQMFYQWYLWENIFQPAGLPDALANEQNFPSCVSQESSPALYYTMPNGPGHVPGSGPTDWQNICGGGGLVLSAWDLGAILAHARYNDNVLSPAMRSQRDTFFLGYQPPTNFGPANGAFGVYRGHSGVVSWGTPARGYRACVMDFPQGVQATIVANFSPGPTPSVCALLQQAYDQAWNVVQP